MSYVRTVYVLCLWVALNIMKTMQSANLNRHVALKDFI